MDKPSDEKEYVERVQKIIDSEQTPLEIVRQLEITDSPVAPSDLARRIDEVVGETLEYEAETTYDYLQGDELEKELNQVAIQIIDKVRALLMSKSA